MLSSWSLRALLFVCFMTWSSPLKAAEKHALHIVTSFFPMYVATLNVTHPYDGSIEVTNLTPPAVGCLHDYQLTPKDMKTLATANVLIINGAGMESFIEPAAKELKHLKIVDASKGLDLIQTDEKEDACCHHHEHEHEHESKSSAHTHSHEEHGVDPHTWMSVSNMMHQVRRIAEDLGRIDEAHAAVYQENAERYVQKLEEARGRMQSTLAKAHHRNIVTFHDGFGYFAKEFDLNIVAVVQSHPGTEPSAKELAKTIQIIRKLGPDVALFAEPQYPSKSAEMVARETGKKLYVLDSLVTNPENRKSVPSTHSSALNAYLDGMERNRRTLEEVLK